MKKKGAFIELFPFYWPIALANKKEIKNETVFLETILCFGPFLLSHLALVEENYCTRLDALALLYSYVKPREYVTRCIMAHQCTCNLHNLEILECTHVFDAIFFTR